mmetsp:Transcript_25951/g.46913  ORF Transcript_25951/g.46913 Transcript_25951/m.46913 type:complete len:458 (-) Transcript_25951:114-1487(-)
MEDARAAPLQQERRSRLASSASETRLSRAGRVGKSWISSENDQAASAVLDANEAGIQSDEAVEVVKCTTRFATVMCVIIAFVKVSLYFATGQQLSCVKTSALDSLGDLVANIITLYTGYRMTNLDTSRYPVGQSKFQNIGCLVFSTLMFALMFGNALNNLETLMETKDEVGYKAISRFFYQTEAVGKFADWHADVKLENAAREIYVWNEDESAEEIRNPLKPFFAQSGDEDEKAMAKEMEDNVTRAWVVEQTSNYENEAQLWELLKTQNKFLACCATYKFCLWLYCVMVAIPKSGSSILVALATDKRNDFICTGSIVVLTTLAFLCKDSLSAVISEDAVDPFVSLILSFFIMYNWSELMVEHCTVLSQEAASEDFELAVRTEINQVLHGTVCCAFDKDVKVYFSSNKFTVEVVLTVLSDNVLHSAVSAVAAEVEMQVSRLEDIERVIVSTKHSALSS